MIDQQPTVLSLTDAAVGKLQELTKEETNPQIGLRVYVYSGGCSGFRYGMMLEDAPTPDDRVLEASGIKVYVDGQSVDLLKGARSTTWTRSWAPGSPSTTRTRWRPAAAARASAPRTTRAPQRAARTDHPRGVDTAFLSQARAAEHRRLFHSWLAGPLVRSPPGPLSQGSPASALPRCPSRTDLVRTTQ